MPTISDIYLHAQAKNLSTRVLVAGQDVSYHLRPQVDFTGGPGTVPTASFDVLNPLPSFLTEGAAVQLLWGFNNVMTKAFVGTVNDITLGNVYATIDCVGSSNALKVTYRRQVVTLASVDASLGVTNLLDSAGVTNYHVDLPAWTIGTVVPGLLEFENYGEAINEIAHVDGTPYYEMPDGQTRVEVRDPIPSSSAFRTYYSGQLKRLTAAQRLSLQEGLLPLTDIQPDAITDPDLQPRLRSLRIGSRFSEVKNKIIALGAVVASEGLHGQQDSVRLEADLQGPSPFIPIPPQYQELSVDFGLVDDIDKLTQAGIRTYGLRNRLERVGTAVVDGDPEIFYGATVLVVDPDFTGEQSLFFVNGYKTSVSDGDFVTELSLTGGPTAGTSPLIAPFACFTWAVTGKVNQVMPVGIGPGNSGVIITFDATCSRDFDGTIPDSGYAWSDDQGNVGSGIFFQAAYNPATTSSVAVTLTVTDADGLTGQTTKTVNVAGDDSAAGGQATVPTFIFAASEEFAMGTKDGGATWNDINRAAAGVTGKFVNVSAMHFGTPGDGDEGVDWGAVALFITDVGEVFVSLDCCVTGFRPHQINTGSNFGFGTGGPSTYGLIPIMGPSAACWLIVIGDGGPTPAAAGTGFLFWFAQDSSVPEQAGWSVASVGATMPGGIRVNRAQGYPTPYPGWVFIEEQIRSNL